MSMLSHPSAGAAPYQRAPETYAAVQPWRGGAFAAVSNLWVAAALITALALRLFRLGDAPLWFDETVTAEWVRASWSVLLHDVLRDNHPPLYFLLLKAWSSWAGDSAAALRFPSAVASALCVPLIAAAAGVAGGRRAMHWAAWTAAIAPLLVHHGQEARSYALVAFLASLHFLILIRFLQGDTRRLGWSYALVGALLAWSHYYGAGFVLVEATVLGLIDAARWRQWAAPAVAGCVAALVAALPATLLAYHQTGGGYEFGVLAIPGVFWGLLTEYTMLPSSAELHLVGVSAALRFAPIALLCGLCVAATLLWGLQCLDRRTRFATLATIGAVVVGPYAASLVMDVGMHPRYALPSLSPLVVVLTAAASVQGYGRLPRQLLGVILAVMAIGTARHMLDPAHGREEVDRAGLWIEEHVPEHQQILVTSNEMAQLARFHWPKRRLRIYPDARAVVTEANVRRIAAELPLSFSGRAFYVIGRDWVSDPQRVLETELMRHYTLCEGVAVRGIRILCLHSLDEMQPLPCAARTPLID